jgi:hypothetical protein
MTVKDRYNGIQDSLKFCGEFGCHFLTLLTIIEEDIGQEVDLIDAIRVSQSKGWFTSDFEGIDALAFLKHYTNKTWYRKPVKSLPAKIKDNEYTEVKYYNPKTKYTHFRRRGIDPLVNSVTVRDGYILEYYIYWY